MDRRTAEASDPEMDGMPTDYEHLELSEWGLDWGDISLIRAQLERTPTERLMMAQDLINAVIQIRKQRPIRSGRRDPQAPDPQRG